MIEVEDLRLSVFQICSTDSFEENSQKILSQLKVQNLKEVDLCVFPENALYININKNDKAPEIKLESQVFKNLQNLAKKNEVNLHLGSVPIYRDGELYNSTIFIDHEGVLHQPYDKIHLFAAQIGDLDIDEGRTYSSGAKLSIIDVKGWSVGLSICFDLRFSELYSQYAKEGCDLILIPSAFFRKTGVAHWETLVKARAIESQCYVAAPGQVGVHKSVDGESIRKSYGHSLVVHPWGNVLADLEEQESSVTLTLKKEEIQKIRNSVLMKRKL